ncbi:MAG: HAD-IIB family hydrolase, partial [Persicimonas sp.]
MLLATDLDGTLLGGDEAEKRRLYAFLNRLDNLQLAFVTGRGLESVMPLLSDPTVPRPDYIVADVGAMIVDGEMLEPVQPIQAEISERWPGTLQVVEALDDIAYLTRQDVPQERRCSFIVDEQDIDDELEAAVDRLGCRLLFSAGRYLDVLPVGVDKGSTLEKLADLLEVPYDEVIVAGDTLNDLAMFETGFRGIVVGNAESGLTERVGGAESVYLADAHGAGGILEAFDRFEPLAKAAPIGERRSSREGDSQMVMVYHRLPFEEVEIDGKTVRRPPSSPNGIIPTLLDFFRTGYRGSWVAWSLQKTRNPDDFEVDVQLDDDSIPDLTCARVPLTDDDVERFYKKFSKEALWPVLFSFPSYATFNQDDWEHFVEI